MQNVLQPLSGHALMILLVQLALLLVLARGLAEGARRLGQPAVIGELLAGILVGPSVLGALSPALFATIFPPTTEQFHLLEVVSWLGMVLLLLLTGLETDIRLIRHLGRAALSGSVFGMVVPFAAGFAFAVALPDAYLNDPADRYIFAAFFATAMSISAMPVIAKILMDLDMIRRNVGVVILSAGVVDDTTGWLILSIIAGLAAGGVFSPRDIGMTLLYLGLFLGAVRLIAYPLLARAIRAINERVSLAGADLSLLLGFTFIAAAATEAIGIHAVFGAFVAGLVIRQLPRVKATSLHSLESFVLAALSPIFFAYVGLRVDLFAIQGIGFPALVLGLAVLSKLVGCYAGGRLGGMSSWESLALGFGMNARGAMGLIVALIGLSLGLLTGEVFSTIVVVAVLTSLMAPLTLRWVLPRIALTDSERRRLEDTERQLLIPAGPLRLLVPTAGGHNALGGFELAAALARQDRGEVVALFVDGEQRPGAGLRRLLWRRSSLAGTNLDAHLASARAFTELGSGRFSVRRVSGRDVAEAVLQEVRRDYDLLFLGAAPDAPFHDRLARRVVQDTPIPVVFVHHRGGADASPFRHLLVPVDGSLFSRLAAEFAFACAGRSGAAVTVLHVVNETRLDSGSLAIPERKDMHLPLHRQVDQIHAQLHQTLDPIANLHDVGFATRVLASGSPGETIIAESGSGYYDLLVLGAENKILNLPLFSGQGTAEIVSRAGCSTAVVVPRIEGDGRSP